MSSSKEVVSQMLLTHKLMTNNWPPSSNQRSKIPSSKRMRRSQYRWSMHWFWWNRFCSRNLPIWSWLIRYKRSRFRWKKPVSASHSSAFKMMILKRRTMMTSQRRETDLRVFHLTLKRQSLLQGGIYLTRWSLLRTKQLQKRSEHQCIKSDQNL